VCQSKYGLHFKEPLRSHQAQCVVGRLQDNMASMRCYSFKRSSPWQPLNDLCQQHLPFRRSSFSDCSNFHWTFAVSCFLERRESTEYGSSRFSYGAGHGMARLPRVYFLDVIRLSFFSSLTVFQLDYCLGSSHSFTNTFASLLKQIHLKDIVSQF